MDNLAELIEKLRAKDWEIRKAAVKALGERGDRRALEPLIKSLGDVNYYVREAVAEALEKIDPGWAKTEEAKKLVPEFIKALKDGDWRVRKAACLALGKLGDGRAVKHIILARADKNTEVSRAALRAIVKIGEPAIEPLTNFLGDKKIDKWIRIVACIALGEIGDKRAVEPLIDALSDEDSEVRRRVADVLGDIGDRRAVRPLIRALEDENEFVNWSAAKALGKIGDKRAVEPLIWALNNINLWGWIRLEAARGLGKMGDKRAVGSLINALREKDATMRSIVAKALGEIGDKRAVEPLIWALWDTTNFPVLESIVEALNKIEPDWSKSEIAKKLVSQFIKVLNDKKISLWDRQRSIWVLGEMGDKRAVEPLVRILEREDACQLTASAASALSRIGKPAIGPLLKLLRTKNSHVRKLVAKALATIGEPAVECLINLLQDGPPEVRESAAEVLGKIGDKRALKPLIRSLGDVNDYVREAVAEALEKIDPNWAKTEEARKLVPVSIRALEDGDSQARESAAWVLGTLGDKRVVQHLISALKDEDKCVRRSAVAALGKLSEKRALKSITEPGRNSGFPANLAAVEPLNKIEPDWSKSEEAKKVIVVEHLINALKDEDKCVRRFAALALGKLGDKRAVKPLITLLERDKNSDVRRTAVYALGELRDKRAVKPLISRLRCWEMIPVFGALAKIGKPAVEPLINALQDRDPVIRTIAAQTLGKIGDKRAVEPLINLLEDQEVMIFAADALGQIGDKRAIKPLIERALKSNYFALSAFKALRKIGKPAIEPLIDVLVKTEDWDIMRFTRETLEKIDPNWSDI